MKETKRLYLALLVLAVGFFWCMCAGLFWPAQAAEDPEKGAREAVHAAVAAEGGRDWDAFLDLQCAAARGRWGPQIGAHYRDKRPTGVDCLPAVRVTALTTLSDAHSTAICAAYEGRYDAMAVYLARVEYAHGPDFSGSGRSIRIRRFILGLEHGRWRVLEPVLP